MAEPNYGGAYVNKVSQDEIDAVYEKAAMKASDHHPAPGSYVPSMPDILKAAAKEAEPEEEARFGGAFETPDINSVDLKPIIDKKCHVNCHHAWEEYEKCEKRIEAKESGDCASWKCIDTCASQVLFKGLH